MDHNFRHSPRKASLYAAVIAGGVVSGGAVAIVTRKPLRVVGVVRAPGTVVAAPVDGREIVALAPGATVWGTVEPERALGRDVDVLRACDAIVELPRAVASVEGSVVFDDAFAFAE